MELSKCSIKYLENLLRCFSSVRGSIKIRIMANYYKIMLFSGNIVVSIIEVK